MGSFTILENIDNFLRGREEKYGYDFQSYFRSIEDHMQAGGEDEDQNTGMDSKQDPFERACYEYGWRRNVLNERKESVLYSEKYVTVV